MTQKQIGMRDNRVLDPRRLTLTFVSAIFHATLWLVVFSLTEHPVEEWPAAIATLYTVWLISINAIVYSAAVAARYLECKLRTLIDKLDLDPDAKDYSNLPDNPWYFIVPLIGFMILALGLSLSASSTVLTTLGFAALPNSFLIIGIGFAVLGVSFVVVLIGLSIVALNVAKKLVSYKEQTVAGEVVLHEPSSPKRAMLLDRIARTFTALSKNLGNRAFNYRYRLLI